MAEGPPARPGFVQRNSLFEKSLEGKSRFFVPSDVQRQSAAAIRAIVDDDDDDDEAPSRKEGAGPEEPASRVVDLRDRQDAATASATQPATIWTRLRTGWEEVEERLAGWFGLDQSKYQWAVDELLERQLAGDQPPSKANINGLQMQNIEEQSMQRDLKGPKPQDA